MLIKGKEILMGEIRVLPLYPPPKGEPCPNEISIELVLILAFLSVGYSGKKIFDFFDSPFGGGVRGRILIPILQRAMKTEFIALDEVAKTININSPRLGDEFNPFSIPQNDFNT
jgi:hypothetical protein